MNIHRKHTKLAVSFDIWKQWKSKIRTCGDSSERIRTTVNRALAASLVILGQVPCFSGLFSWTEGGTISSCVEHLTVCTLKNKTTSSPIQKYPSASSLCQALGYKVCIRRRESFVSIAALFKNVQKKINVLKITTDLSLYFYINLLLNDLHNCILVGLHEWFCSVEKQVWP